MSSQIYSYLVASRPKDRSFVGSNIDSIACQSTVNDEENNDLADYRARARGEQALWIAAGSWFSLFFEIVANAPAVRNASDTG